MVEPSTATRDVEIDAPTPDDGTPRGTDEAVAALVEQDLLVEDVSIDGMCGVY